MLETELLPPYIFLDNGLTFIGAEKKFRHCIEKWTTWKSTRKLSIEELIGGSIHAVRHIKLASERDWPYF